MGSEAGCDAVASGDIELAVVTLPQNSHPKLHAKEIWHDPLMLMVRDDHPLVSEKKDISALQYYPAILPEKGTITRQIIEDALEPFQIRFNTVAETNYLETIRVLVSVGLGWSVLPLSMKNDNLSIINIEELKFMRNLGFVIHKNRTLSNAAVEFCTMLLGDR
jgi:DNA-binding transcriptional LysR family regulator